MIAFKLYIGNYYKQVREQKKKPPQQATQTKTLDSWFNLQCVVGVFVTGGQILYA